MSQSRNEKIWMQRWIVKRFLLKISIFLMLQSTRILKMFRKKMCSLNARVQFLMRASREIEVSMTWTLRKLSIEMTKKISIRKQMKQQQIAEQTSTFSRVECEYVRVIWCCCQIWSFCNVCRYILLFVFWSDELSFFALSIVSFSFWVCSWFSTHAFVDDNSFVLFLLEWINCIAKF